MSDPQPELTHEISDGGIAAKHPPTPEVAGLVGPATGSELNTIRAGIIPVACWRLEDLRFEFDSSFVNPSVEVELKNLEKLVKDHPPTSKSAGKPGFPLSVFGHADPIGDDDYNKKLSGRRATAIYALLNRDTDLWEKLFSQPLGNDRWGKKSLLTMLDKVSPAPPGENNEQQAAQHEQNAGKRKELFLKYMDTLCGPELKLKKEDFLGHGDDANGKGDFQGCSEFNPVLIFSQKDQTRFDRDKDKTERNAANALNRRVVVLIFRQGSRVDPAKWPCPRASEGVAGCKKRFWSDGEQRRSRRLPDQPRKFDETKDTFACRFYHRLLISSPCETILPMIRIRLFDRNARALPAAPCLVMQRGKAPRPDRASGTFQGKTRDQKQTDEILSREKLSDEKQSDEKQDAFIIVRDLSVPTSVTVKWSRPKPGDNPASPLPALTDEFEFKLDVVIDIPADQSEEASLTRLTNMGYVRGPSRADDIREFQRDYKPRFSDIEIDGTLNAATKNAIQKVHDECDPVLKDVN